MRPLRLATMAAIVLCVAACAAIWGFEDLKPSSAGSDGGAESGGGDGAPPCNLDHPEAPGTSDPGGAINFLTAIDTFDIGTHRGDGGSDAARTVAYDLDGVCTCHGVGQESCIRANASDPQLCDDDRGRDDVGKTLLATLQTFVDVDRFTSEGAGDRLRAGKFGILIQVQGYNDLQDDPDVTVYILPSFGLGPVDGGVLDKNTTLPPAFTKSDPWTFDSRFGSKLNADQIIGKGANVAGARKAYVRNGRLVALMDDVFIFLQLLVTNDNPLLIHISDAIATAAIKKNGPGNYQLDDGRISGRWATGDLLRAIGTWDLGPPLSGPLCANAPSSAYGNVKAIVCGKRDIGTRGTAPTKPCDAVSFGLGFTAKPASVGDPAGYPFQTTTCFDGGAPTTLDNYPDNCL